MQVINRARLQSPFPGRQRPGHQLDPPRLPLDNSWAAQVEAEFRCIRPELSPAQFTISTNLILRLQASALHTGVSDTCLPKQLSNSKTTVCSNT